MSVDLTTRYLGLKLKNPLVASACPLTEDLDTLRRLEEAGAAAAVFPSLFEEQIEQEELEIHALHEYGVDSFAEALTYFPELDDYNVGPDGYLRRLEEAKKVVSIPLIGSLNGTSVGGWIRYAGLIQDAGADALELNVYYVAADPDMSARDVEDRYLGLVAEVRRVITIPLAVKVAPFFTAFANLAKRLVGAGADGLVLFNRFVHPDIDLESLKTRPNLKLSDSYESRLPLTWVALLRNRFPASLAATGGIHTHEDVLKLVLAGADVTMIASALYQHGPEHFRRLLEGLAAWLVEREYASLEQMKGSMSQEHCPDPTAFERVNYMKTIVSFTHRSN
ncbi:MAG: dihydroorotate dehydrogenase-like protein [Planctomycetota bacterium]|jgi:dihydroorotate dehydrogenase (fumarate)